MVRTQIYLTEEEKRGLEAEAHSRGVSQSDLIRQAIDALLKKNSRLHLSQVLRNAAGIWADREDIPDVRELRKGWQKRLPQ